MIEGLEVALGVKLKVVIAGTIGGFISLRFFDGLTSGAKWVIALGGLTSAVVFTPALSDYFKLPSSYDGAIGFTLGLFAMSLTAAIGVAIKEGAFKQLIDKLLARFK